MVGNDKAIEILLKSFRRLGLDVDHENAEGLTALLISARLGHLACASLLARGGRSDVTKTDPEHGMTAEEWARSQGCSTPEVMAFTPGAVQQRRRRRLYDTHYVSTSKSRGSLGSISRGGTRLRKARAADCALWTQKHTGVK